MNHPYSELALALLQYVAPLFVILVGVWLFDLFSRARWRKHMKEDDDDETTTWNI